MLKPLILLTNDDGYKAKGLDSIVRELRTLGDLLVVAPNTAASGMSSAITVKVPIRLGKVWEEDGLSIYKCSGTPVDCVKIAINQLMDRKPDMIVSGINHGNNTSVSVLYSGTMGAALEGCINQIPSIGLSLNSYDADADFTAAAIMGRKVVENVLANGLQRGTCLNVNFPSGAEIKGLKVCRQADGVWAEEFEKRVDPHGGTYYWLTGYFKDHEPESEETDEWAIKNGFASVVPCKIDITDYQLMDELKKQLDE